MLQSSRVLTRVAKFNVSRRYITTLPFYLGNRPVQANHDLPVIDKFTKERVARVAIADADIVLKATEICVKATKPMKNLQAFEKKDILMQVSREVAKNKDELANALCAEAGKPINMARLEVDRCVETFEIAAEESVRLYGEYIPLDTSAAGAGITAIVRKFPIGPVSMISPFNFPLNLVAHKVAPAIAAGCPFVLKPATKTPMSALLLGKILSETSLPDGAFSILPSTRKAAEPLTTDPRYKLLTFTGSPAAGWDIKARAGKKKVVLELGGNAACVIDTGVDLDDAVQRVSFGAFYQAGQSCISVQRVYVHEDVYDQFKEKLVAHAATLKKGDPQKEETFVGPLITDEDAKRVEEWVNEAASSGASILIGGKNDNGVYDVTIVENPPTDCRMMKNEIFAPVIGLRKFCNFKDVIDEVNDSKYGLQAGVFTNDFNKAIYAFENIEVGGVCINEIPSRRCDAMPYGGTKDSGIGKEGLKYAIHDMCDERIMVMRNAGKI